MSSKENGMGGYHRLPEWLRWILLFPLAIGLTAVVTKLAKLVRPEDTVFFIPIISMMALLIFLNYLAPSFRSNVVLVGLAFRMLISLGIAYAIIKSDLSIPRSLIIEWAGEAVAWATGLWYWKSGDESD